MQDSVVTYKVPDIHCEGCKAKIEKNVAEVTGVASVSVDLAENTVIVQGQGVEDGAVRAAIGDAGYTAL